MIDRHKESKKTYLHNVHLFAHTTSAGLMCGGFKRLLNVFTITSLIPQIVDRVGVLYLVSTLMEFTMQIIKINWVLLILN